MYECKICKKSYSKWQGRCDNCNEWGSLAESVESSSKLSGSKTQRKSSKVFQHDVIATSLSELNINNSESENRSIISGFIEFDNAVGGRLVPGQVLLLSGTPGIGKSTLSTQLTEYFSDQGKIVFYVCGEESPSQIKQRVDRLCLKHTNVKYIQETNIDVIESFVRQNKNEIKILFVDSIQTIFTPDLNSSSGSIAQITECTNRIVNLAKSLSLTTFIIGHVTKSGDIAGPKMLEHMVDTVLYFEGEKRFELRILRVEKNRFGPTDEVGIFKMTQKGLVQVLDTKELFDSKIPEASGSVFCMVLEGNRPVVVEVQALVTKSYFPQPRRTASGFDFNRMNILIAIIEKILKLNMWEYDVYVNITGGIKINDSALDLAVIQAIISSLKNRIVSRNSIYFGEVGLTGEVRKVWLEEKRIKEAKRIGFDNVVSSRLGNVRGLV